MINRIELEGDWAQIWGVLDNLPLRNRGLKLKVSARIGPEYMLEATMRAHHLNFVKDVGSLSYIAWGNND